MAVARKTEIAAIEPYYDPDNGPPTGSQILHAVTDYLDYFTVWPNAATRDAAALWALHTHAKNAGGMLVFQASPRLLFQSAEPGSGKTHAMRSLSRLCSVAMLFTEPSEPAVAHSIGKKHATLFLDEVDVLFGAGGRKSAIRAIINDGYTPDGMWPRVRGGNVEEIPTFGALAMAGLDKVDTGTSGTLAATLTRCLRMRMKRAPDGWNAPRFNADARVVTAKLNDVIREWVTRNLDALASHEPELPEGFGGRLAELSEPLLTIADVAGEERHELECPDYPECRNPECEFRGRWPVDSRKAMVRLTTSGFSPEDSAEAMVDIEEIMARWKSTALRIDKRAVPEAPEAFALGANGIGPEPVVAQVSTPDRILSILRKPPKGYTAPMHYSDIAKLAECSEGTARTGLSRMANAGKVTRDGKPGFYVAAPMRDLRGSPKAAETVRQRK